MDGWLIYDEAGAKRNAWFIDRLIACANARGLRFILKIYERSKPFEFAFEGENLPRFAIVRTICPALNEWLEKRGVAVVNNAETARIANDKWETYLFCKQWDIPVLPTQKGDFLPDKKDYPLVMKTTDGHGGAEVLWIENGDGYLAAMNAFEKKGRPFIWQKPSGTLGKDMRIYVVGGEIVAAVLRTSERDFRSNFSLGGKVERVEPTETQRAIVRKVCQALKPDFIGIDFLPDGEDWKLNELEDAAGARMLYACTDIDIAELFTEYLARKFEKQTGRYALNNVMPH